VRKRLGGSGQSDPGAGIVVRFVDDPGAGTLGVVLFRDGDELHVYLGDGWLRRTTASAVAPLEVAAPDSLAAVASDARVFASLRSGDEVRYQDGSGELMAGVLLEKCRYGAIVVNEHKRMIGVGFRKLWPVPSTSPA
jgi:hypothetical protein